MSKLNNLTDFLTDLATTIRTKTGTTGTINPQDFSAKIAAIPTGGGSNAGSIADKSITMLSANDLNGATKIGDYAFYYCDKLTSVSIPSTALTIGYQSFYECSSLTSLTLNEGVTQIGIQSFYGTKMVDLVIPNSVTVIYSSAFKNCNKLVNLTIGSGTTTINNDAFASCNKISVITVLATQPPTIVSAAFPVTSLTKIIVPAGTGNTYKSATNWVAYRNYIEEASA